MNAKNPILELSDRTAAVLNQAYGTASCGYILIAVDPDSSQCIVRSNLDGARIAPLLEDVLGRVNGPAPAGANGRPRGLG